MIRPIATGDPATGTDATPTITITGATPDEEATVAWALGRYETAGLPLPTVTVAFHDSDQECRGYKGYYNHNLATIDICARDLTSDPRRTVLHELGHAWSFTYLSETDIAVFVDRRHLDAWHSDDLAWWQMGQEQAAELVAWGLQDANEYQSTWLHLETCDDLAADFELLTGTAPLHTNTQYCK